MTPARPSSTSSSPTPSPGRPARRVGIVGGGQLGRMLALSAAPLGLEVTVLDPKPGPGALPHADHIRADFDDRQAVGRLAEACDVVTWEFENIDADALASLPGETPVYPTIESLRISGDRLREKEFFEEAGIGVAPWRRVDTRGDLAAAKQQFGLPLVLKRRTMGYDGKGQQICRSPDDLETAWKALGPGGDGDGEKQEATAAGLIAEDFVDFERELSVIGARTPDGDIRIYPLPENRHRHGILFESHAPTDVSETTERRARSIAESALQAMDYVGVLAIELFETDDELWVNEMAPRVHNSGHWTIEGAETSQFENHLRAVAGLPLGATRAIQHTRMFNVIGAWPDKTACLEVDGAHLHDYRKAARPGRKIGHVTLRGEDGDEMEDGSERLRTLVGEARSLR